MLHLIEHEWTASGTHTNVQKVGLFNMITAGILTHEGTFTAASLISGDKLKVSYTVNLGLTMLIPIDPSVKKRNIYQDTTM